jgi:HEPN domain-containing protein/predicted nucleotidyltransferase
MEDYPKTLLELEQRFSTEDACVQYLFGLRWPFGFSCPLCGNHKAWKLKAGSPRYTIYSVYRSKGNIPVMVMYNRYMNALISDITNSLWKAVFPFNIKGAAVFGSSARGEATPHSDIDILIVAEGINPKRHRRGEEILAIKKILPSVPLDILLLSPDEVVSNFENHNPLFLDIAEEGVVLFDTDGFLSRLIAETRAYIEARGIEKIKGGWEFPVQYGVATYLSQVSNKDFSLAMLKDGERDYVIGRKLIEEGFYDKAVYHFQQAVEKAVKAVLVAFGIFQKTHFVGEVLIETVNAKKVPDIWKGKLIRIAELSESIEPDVSLSRYPGIIGNSIWLPYEEYGMEDAEKAQTKGEEVLTVAKEFISSWFTS